LNKVIKKSIGYNIDLTIKYKSMKYQKNKNDLISHYVNLYRLVWGTNEGLFSNQLENLSVKKLEKGIQMLKSELFNRR